VRIVSLLPSATEILFAIGAGDDVTGVTFECDYPELARSRRIVSTTALPAGLAPGEIDAVVRSRLASGEDLYHLDEGALHDLDPTLIVTQDLCAVCAIDVDEVDAALRHLGCQALVVTLDPMSLEDVLSSIEVLGESTDRAAAAARLVTAMKQRLETVALALAGTVRPRVAVLEWTDPPFSSGHWVPDLVTAAGGEPVLGASGCRSAEVSWSEVHAAEPDVIIVAPCGFHLEGAVQLARQLVASGALPTGVPVWAVDADSAFVRPGPRLVEGVETLAGIIHPEAVALNPSMSQQIELFPRREEGSVSAFGPA
jgi:iron complex transport system substrate-binding protein